MLNNSTLSGNTALRGAGIYNDGTATLTNTTLSGNSAAQNGGGIYSLFDLGLLNVTLSSNSAASGGALFMQSGYTATLTNTIVADSPTGGNCSGPISSSAYSISSDLTCALSGLVHGVNPNGLILLLTGLGNYGGPTQVHMLRLGSPAIDGIVGSNAPVTDQRGHPRPVDGDGDTVIGYDIGAVVRQPSDSSLAPLLFLPETVQAPPLFP
jgi:predicted outer membrane repeat protein